MPQRDLHLAARRRRPLDDTAGNRRLDTHRDGSQRLAPRVAMWIPPAAARTDVAAALASSTRRETPDGSAGMARTDGSRIARDEGLRLTRAEDIPVRPDDHCITTGSIEVG